MRTKLLAALGAALVSATGAEAATIVDTGGNSNGDTWSFHRNQYFAGKFSVDTDSSITAVAAYLSTWTGGNITATLFSDAANFLDKALYSQTFAIGTRATAGWYGLNSLRWNVSAGEYWLAFTPDNAVNGTWFGSAPSPLSEYTVGYAGQWPNRGADYFDSVKAGFRVDAVANAGAVPEPATWAMLILGFIVVGYTMRSRTKVRFVSAI